MKNILKDEQGSNIVVVALSITVILVFAAFVVDLGAAYFKTAEVQTAADAAVMAAGMELPVNVNDTSKQSSMIATVLEYLNKNGITDTTEVNVYFSDEENEFYTRIGVDVPATSPTEFAKIIGVNEVTFTRSAEARTIPCTALSDLVPLSAREDVLAELIASGNTEHVILKYGSNTEEVEQGAFGAIDLDGVKGGGANDYVSWLENGYQGELTVGTILPIEGGNMDGPTLTGLSERFNACTHYQSIGGCTAEHYVSDCPRVMKVPVIQYVDSKNVKIVGFAAFIIEDYTTYADDGYVIGTYVDMVNIGASKGDLTGTAEDFGVYSLTLSK
ncbi:MAG TPA: pilus assembly protein TadG-related protein [Oscillospiraceae bacterium]|nr:pilus assembly protein TadG-related protein [Oscillospiraceae bacterium]HPF55301.1 pilus assembly protein TadG-related protein [Clostridiales bacterium]HPK34704.1 pilus assembly protein TadG-related protein [Oscillospiraceae bacterium]HPR74532.1 pilus assembly protein TadG-related protein [Oscillospiraceae bacterium]